MACLGRRSLEVMLCGAFLYQRMEFFLVEKDEGACVRIGGNGCSYVAVVKAMIFDGKIPELLKLLDLAIFPVCL